MDASKEFWFSPGGFKKKSPDDFKNPTTGRVVRHPTGYFAFVPTLLLTDLPFDRSLVLALSRADAALSELSGQGHRLPNPHLLIAPLVRREAVSSSRIEGTRASISDVLLEEAGAAEGNRADAADVREVRNYVSALEHGIARLAELPLSLRLVRELHAKLMDGVRGEHATPGEFRRSQNWIGPALDSWTLESLTIVNDGIHSNEEAHHVLRPGPLWTRPLLAATR